MKTLVRLLMVIIVAWHAGAAAQAASGDKPYVVLEEDLQQLKDDFNAKVGTVRLLFILGPTCGICLRGMADLNDEVLAENQADPRLNTFAVYVPTLRAEEKHVAPAMQLMMGPRIYHYWDEVGKIGLHYQPVLDTEAYVWDVWFIYDPDAIWEGDAPPLPAYWEHQLPTAFPSEKKLDKKRFAAEILHRVNDLSLDDFDATAVAASDNPLADGAIIPWVGQGFGKGVKQYVQSRGGGKNIQSMVRRESKGKVFVGSHEFNIDVTEARPNSLTRRIWSDFGEASTKVSERKVERNFEMVVKGLSIEGENHLFSNYDFDGALYKWSSKSHKVEMQGMEKIGDVLAWNLVLTQADGSRWVYLVDSHTGAIAQQRALDENGVVMFAVKYTDYREVDGALFAHKIEYLDAAGDIAMTEIYDQVGIVGD